MSIKSFKRGDTIIEVLLSIAILGLALALCYSLANRSLRTGLSANARTEAMAVTQGQVELLKAARYSILSETEFNNRFGTNSPSGTFCISRDASVNRYSSTDTRCSVNGYRTSINYSNINGVYTFSTNWDSFTPRGSGTANNQDTLTVYYRVPR